LMKTKPRPALEPPPAEEPEPTPPAPVGV